MGAENVDVVSEHAFAGIGHVEDLTGNQGIVIIRGGYGGYSSRASGKCGAVDADVRQHSGVAGGCVTREAQLTIIDGKGCSASNGCIDHYVVSLAWRHEDFVLYTGQAGQRIAIFRNQTKAGSCGRSG